MSQPVPTDGPILTDDLNPIDVYTRVSAGSKVMNSVNKEITRENPYIGLGCQTFFIFSANEKKTQIKEKTNKFISKKEQSNEMDL